MTLCSPSVLALVEGDKALGCSEDSDISAFPVVAGDSVQFVRVENCQLSSRNGYQTQINKRVQHFVYHHPGRADYCGQFFLADQVSRRRLLLQATEGIRFGRRHQAYGNPAGYVQEREFFKLLA